MKSDFDYNVLFLKSTGTAFTNLTDVSLIIDLQFTTQKGQKLDEQIPAIKTANLLIEYKKKNANVNLEGNIVT